MSSVAAVQVEHVEVAAADEAVPNHRRRHRHGNVARIASSRWRQPAVYAPTTREPKKDEAGNDIPVRKMKHATRARRHTAYLQSGKGAIGIRVRRSRVKAWTRELRESKLPLMVTLLGAEGNNLKSEHWSTWKDFVPPVQGALQLVSDEVTAMARDFAKGTQLRDEHMKKAIKWYTRCRTQ